MRKAIRLYQASTVYFYQVECTISIKTAPSTCHYIGVARYREYSVTRMHKRRVADRYLISSFLTDKSDLNSDVVDDELIIFGFPP